MSDHLEERLGRVLHDRAEGVLGAPLTVHDVRRTARTIRRRRRAGAAGVALAALAVLVPVGAQLVERPDSAPDPVQPAPTPRPDGTFRLGLRDLPDGDRPGVSYGVGSSLFTPETEVELPERYVQVVPSGDGHLALAARTTPGDDRFSVRLVRLDAAYREVEDVTAAAPVLALSPDRSRVAWVEPTDGGVNVVVLPTEGDQQVRLEVPAEYAEPVGFLPDGSVAVGIDEGDGYLAAYAAVGLDGEVRPIEGFQRLSDVDASGRMVGQTDYRDATGVQCSGARDLAGALLWERCGLEVGGLSPDGRYVLGFNTGEVAGESTFLTVLDAATGEPVLEMTSARGAGTYVSDPVWEDQDTVLAVVDEGDEEAIVRFELDGRAEQATAAVEGEGGMGSRHHFLLTPQTWS